MSFFGNNSRPDLLRNANDSNADRSGASSARYAGEMPAYDETAPAPFTGDARSSYAAATAPKDRATASDQCTNVVAAGARWKGSLKVEDSVRIDGIFSGDVETKGTIHISEGAEVDAKLQAAFVVVAGSFRGEIKAEQKTELLPTSKVTGEVITRALSVHEGATVDGTIQMSGDTRTNGNNRRNGATPADSESDAAPAERRARSETPAN